MGAALQRARRALVVDTMHNYNCGMVANPLPGFVDVYSIPALVALLRRVRNGNFRICYKPNGLKLAAEFDAVARLIWETKRCTFAVDEIWNYCRGAWMPDPLRQMALQWGHRGITVLYTAQRPQSVSPDLRDNTTEWCIFQLGAGSLALDCLRGKVPGDVLEAVPALPKWAYMQVNDRGEWRRVMP
jgi:hypothetical protein